ncbi:MAG: hypothetical protein WBB01_17570 [Phormidesmis sp.]
MNFFSALLAKIKVSWFSLKLIFVISAFLIGVILLLHFWEEAPMKALTGDLASLADFPVYYGFLSQIGILFWAGSVTVCLFSFRLCSDAVGYRTFKTFFLASALLTTLLGLDDLFLIHEVILPKYLGIPQAVTFGVYGALIVLYFLKFYPIILRTAYIPLMLSLFFFFISVLIDINILPTSSPFHEYLFEDGAKLVGILSWLVYYFEIGEYIAMSSRSLKLN